MHLTVDKTLRLSVLLALALLLVIISGCGSVQESQREKLVTLLFTNDFESAYDPIPAFWRDDMANIGGIAELATLIENQRAAHSTLFLFDAGDIFTGTLAQLTRGEIAFELMNSMAYDAMGIGNHEFEFGWQEFARQKKRAAFPVLGANLTYKADGRPYAQPYAEIERNGVRVGVIGVMGQDAATALIPNNLAGVAVSDPVLAVKKYTALLRERVDLIVVLTHQGPTAPMQTNDEADPAVYRGNAENLALAAAVPGIDVIFAGHTDAGTPQALRDPVNGTLIMQTWGQGQHLGLLQLSLDQARINSSEAESGRPKLTLVRSELIPVDSDSLPANPKITATLERYRNEHREVFAEVGTLEQSASRRYYQESSLGNLLADIVREQGQDQGPDQEQVDVGLMPGGALRKDLPQGVLRRIDLLDMFPFKDRVAVVELRGETLSQIVEQGLSLERGLLQVSGLDVGYDPKKPVGSRLISLAVNGRPVETDRIYRVATLEILAQGGDSYVQFRDARSSILSDDEFSVRLMNHFARSNRAGAPVKIPPIGRYRVIH